MKSGVIRKRSRHDASAAAAAAAARRSVADTYTSQASYINATHRNSHHPDARTPRSGSSGSGTTSASASPDASVGTSPNVNTLDVSELNGSSGLGGLSGGTGDRSPTLAPDSTMQPAAYEFGGDGVVNVGVHGVLGVGTAGTSGSELMGALGGDNVASGYGSVSSLNMSGLGSMPMNMNSMGLGIDGEGAANGVTLGGIHVGGALGHAYGIFGHHGILARIIRITYPPSFTWMWPFHLRVLTGWRGRRVLPAAVQAEETKGREMRQTRMNIGYLNTAG
ncbi:hypothetical protein EDC04DRAFT_1331027 [Pisolithus marmoratus]|nr:hypothetical protein EDC04DRAFT_1331027 [Pisolithus marmoratus]